jgi:hypothetical protein
VVQDLRREQPLLGHALVRLQLEADRHPAQVAARHGSPVFRELEAQDVDLAVQALQPRLEDLLGSIAGAAAEQGAYPGLGEAEQLLEGVLPDQEQLRPHGESAGQRALQAEAPVQERDGLHGEAEAGLPLQLGPVGLQAALLERVEEPPGLADHEGRGPARGHAPAELLDVELCLAVGDRAQRGQELPARHVAAGRRAVGSRLLRRSKRVSASSARSRSMP